MTQTARAPAATPDVVVRRPDGPVRAVALLLPGGKADSLDPMGSRQLAGLRMLPFAASLHRGGADSGLAVWTLRYRFRGWNGGQMSPVHDAAWALHEVRRRHGDVPVVLVGHSMGGRTAMRVAGDDSVVGTIGLAPWLPDGEPVSQLDGRHVLIAHGNIDTITSARASRRFADRARDVASSVEFLTVRGEMHAMVLRWSTWHRVSTTYALDVLGLRPMSQRMRQALSRGYV